MEFGFDPSYNGRWDFLPTGVIDKNTSGSSYCYGSMITSVSIDGDQVKLRTVRRNCDSPEDIAMLSQLANGIKKQAFDTRFSGEKELTHLREIYGLQDGQPLESLRGRRAWVIEVSTDGTHYSRGLVTGYQMSFPSRWSDIRKNQNHPPIPKNPNPIPLRRPRSRGKVFS